MIFSTFRLLKSLRAYLNLVLLRFSNTSLMASYDLSLDLRRLADPSDLSCLPPIEYAYDPLPALPRHLQRGPFPFPSGATAKNPYLLLNSVPLDPLSAGLPYRSGMDHVHASKYWESNLSEANELLKLLATDNSAADIEVDHGITLSKLATKALQPGFEHRMALACHYMFPCASKERTRLISALMIVYFVFDDKIEETPNEKLKTFRDDFLRRLQKKHSLGSSSNPFHAHMDDILRSIEAEDEAGGDGGKEMLDALRDAFRCVHPENNFQSVDDYLRFRRLNVGAAFVIAAAKFSIKSSVSISDPRFSRYLSLIGDHLGLVNDLASYDKEALALHNGETGDMINVVDVIKDVTTLGATDDAKNTTWLIQLQIEQQMMAEIESLLAQGLTNEEWWFLEVVQLTAVGNVMFCMTTSRYGGEAARVKHHGDPRGSSLS